MRLEIIERTRQMADHIIATGATVRATAEKFGISKSTVHKDMTERLYYVDRKKYYLVQAALQKISPKDTYAAAYPQGLNTA